MPKFIPVEISKTTDKKGYIFQCPECNCSHAVQTNPKFQPYWNFNGDVDCPTISPSVLVKSDYDGDTPKSICHSFIKEGEIQFLNDCTHHLASTNCTATRFG